MRVRFSGVFACLIVLLAPVVLAQEKSNGQTCQEQLNDTTVLAHNVATDRNQKEKVLANAQVLIMQLKQRNEQLEKQLIDLRKTLAPKGEEKKPE